MLYKGERIITFREWYKEKYEVEWKFANPEEEFPMVLERLANHMIEYTEDIFKQPTPNTPKKAHGK